MFLSYHAANGLDQTNSWHGEYFCILNKVKQANLKDGKKFTGFCLFCYEFMI